MQGSLSSVIPERKKPLPAFSGEGIRWDVWVTVLSLVLVLALCVLCIDIGALESGSRRIGKLTSGISSLEQRNSFLREEISDALSDPLLVFTAAKQETENREGSTTIMLSAGP